MKSIIIRSVLSIIKLDVIVNLLVSSSIRRPCPILLSLFLLLASLTEKPLILHLLLQILHHSLLRGTILLIFINLHLFFKIFQLLP